MQGVHLILGGPPPHKEPRTVQLDYRPELYAGVQKKGSFNPRAVPFWDGGAHCAKLARWPGLIRRFSNAAVVAPYNQRVARGWESKSVESQQEDVRSAAEPKQSLTPQERDVESRRQALRLSRSLIVQRLHAAENPRYRKVLERALADLDRQLSQLN